MFFFLRFFAVLCLALVLLFVFFYVPVAGKTSWNRLRPDSAPAAVSTPAPAAAPMVSDKPLENLSPAEQAGLDDLVKAKLKTKRPR